MEVFREAIEMALTVGIRLGLPVIVLFLVGYLGYRADRRRRAMPVMRQTGGTPGLDRSGRQVLSREGRRSCWELKRCPAATAVSCPAFQRQDLPCWRAVRLARGHVGTHCFGCELFLMP